MLFSGDVKYPQMPLLFDNNEVMSKNKNKNFESIENTNDENKYLEIGCGDKIRAIQNFICGDKNPYKISKNTIMEVTNHVGDAIVVDNKGWDMQHWIEIEDFDKIEKVKDIKFSKKMVFDIKEFNSNKINFNFYKPSIKNINPDKDFEIAKKLNEDTLKALEYLEGKHFSPNIKMAKIDTWFPKILEDNLSVCENLIPEGFPINILDSKINQTWYSDVIALINGDKRNYGTPTYEVPQISAKKQMKQTYEEKNGNLNIFEEKVFSQPNCGEQHSYMYNTELIVGDFENIDWKFFQSKNRRKRLIEKCSKSMIGYCLCKIFYGYLPPSFELNNHKKVN